MRIELNAGGLSNGAAVMDFQSDFGALSKGSRWMVQSFQNIRNYAYNMNGGVGILQDAVDEISARITEDEQRAGEIEKDLQKADDFIELAKKVDRSVRKLVIKNRDEFYEVNPWAKPPPPPEEKNLREKIWDWACKTVGDVKEGISNIVGSVKEKVHNVVNGVKDWVKAGLDTIKKGWDNIVTWCKENKDFIKQVLIDVAIGAAVIGLAALTGGASLAITVAIAAGVGAAVGGVGGVVGHVIEHGTLKGAGKAFVGGAAKGFMTGAISGFVGGGVGAAGKALQLGRGATTALGAVSNGLASAGGETIHALADGNGISAAERGDIIRSGIIGTISGGISSFRQFENGVRMDTGLDKLRHNDKFLADTSQKLRDEAIRSMRQGQPNSIFNAQESIKDLTALKGFLVKQIAKDEIISGLKQGGAETAADIISGRIFH